MSGEVYDSFMKVIRSVKRRPGKPERVGVGRLMAALCREDGLRVKDLADMLDIRPPSLTELLNGLETGGHIVRRRDPADSRATLIYVTQEGREEHERHDRQREQTERLFESALSESERAEFIRLCAKLSEAFEFEPEKPRG